jgi:membrane protein DedA with SNARE-associated domain
VEAVLLEFMQSLEELDPRLAYGLLLLSALLENIVPPVPGDTVVIFSAYMVGRGTWQLWPVFGVTVVGGVLGFMVMYYMGLRYGRSFFSGRRGRLFSAEGLEKAEAWLARYGLGLLLANRFLSGIRSVIAISAGIGGMSWQRVFICGVLSMALWNGILLYVGLLVGQNWEEVSLLLKQYNRALVGLLIVAALVGVWRWRTKA